MVQAEENTWNSVALTSAIGQDGEISRKHGDTLIGTLLKIYGPGFATGCDDQQKLSEPLATLHDHSLSQLARHHERGELQGEIDHAG
jgi:hypothetical protein